MPITIIVVSTHSLIILEAVTFTLQQFGLFFKLNAFSNFWWFDWFMVFNATLNNISVNFNGGGNRSTQRKPHTYRKSLTNFIT
jgi:hypothetical protein